MSVSNILSVIAPQYNSTAGRDTFIQMAENLTNRCWYGVNADLAVALRSAHMMALNTASLRLNGEAGAISSKKEGDLSIAFQNVSSGFNDSDLSQTHYGRQLIGLVKTGGMFLGVTGGNDCGC